MVLWVLVAYGVRPKYLSRKTKTVYWTSIKTYARTWYTKEKALEYANAKGLYCYAHAIYFPDPVLSFDPDYSSGMHRGNKRT